MSRAIAFESFLPGCCIITTPRRGAEGRKRQTWGPAGSAAVVEGAAEAGAGRGGGTGRCLAPRRGRVGRLAGRHVGQRVLIENVDEGAECVVEDLVDAAPRLAACRPV